MASDSVGQDRGVGRAGKSGPGGLAYDPKRAGHGAERAGSAVKHFFQITQNASGRWNTQEEKKKAMKKFVSTSFVLLLWSAAGCSTIRPPEVYDQAKLDAVRTAYVVKSEADGRNMSVCVAKALRKKGIDSSYGDRSSIPAEADVYVTVEDEWMWDIVMYLRSLRVALVDTASN